MKGYFTKDNIDYNQIWNNFVTPGVDRYNEVDKTDLEILLAIWTDEQISRYPVFSGQSFRKLGDIEPNDRNKPVVYGKFQALSEKFGSGFSYDENYLKDAMQQDILNYQASLLDQDRMNIKSELLRTCMTDATNGFWNGSFETDEGITVPPKFGANIFLAAHTHYITAGATTIDLAYCATLRHHILEHGFVGNLVGWINSTDEMAITKLLMPTNSAVQVSNPLTDRVAVEGFIARVGGINWVTTELMPAGHGLVVAVNLAVPEKKVARLIYPTNASFRGLRIVPGGFPDWPIFDSYYSRFLGSKIMHRSGGVAFQLTASSTYANPTIT